MSEKLVCIDGKWFARPSGPGSDVGPFSTFRQALDWLSSVRATTERREQP